MPSTQTTVVSNGDIDFYFTSVNTSYLRALKGNNKALYPKIAYVPPAGVQTVEKVPILGAGGSVVNGTRIKFPISLAASAPRIWQEGEPRPIEPFSSVEVAVDMRRWCVPSKREYYDQLTADIFGIIQGQMPQMMDRSMILWDRVLAETIANNAVWDVDQVPFFTPLSAPHYGNPLKKLYPYASDFSISGIDEPNMRFLISALENNPGPDGLPLDTDDVKLIVLAPTKDMAIQLKNVFNAVIAAVEVNANAGASRTNQMVGEAEVMTFKQLARTTNAPVFSGTPQDRGKVGYILAVPSGEDRPLAVVPRRQPTAYYTGLNGADHLRASQGAVEFGWDAFGAAKLMLPTRALRFVVNPA